MRFLIDIEVTDFEAEFIDRDDLEFILRAALVDGLTHRNIDYLTRAVPEDLTNGSGGFFATIDKHIGVLK